MKISVANIVTFVGLPLAVVVIIVGYVWSLQAAERHDLLNQFSTTEAPPNNAIMSDDAVLVQYIKDYGPAPTMKTIIAASQQTGIECHNRAHVFGRLSYEQFGEEVLKLNLPECHSGFYHGAIEAYFKANGTDGLKEKLSYICPANLNTFFMHQCRHGLGHGLMAWSNYELPETLDYCSMIDEPGGQASCRTGAFMENIVGSLVTDNTEARAAGHFTKYLSNDPQYPCNVVKEEYKADCYFLQTDRMFQLANNSLQGIVDGCMAAPAQYHYVCFASMGRTVGGIMRGRPAEGLQACQLIPEQEGKVQCIIAIAKDTLWDPSGQEAGFTFCGLVPAEDSQIDCYRGLIQHAVDILSPEQLATFCSRLPQELYTECTSGSPLPV